MTKEEMALNMIIALRCIYPFVAACGASFYAPVFVHLPDDMDCAGFMALMDVWGDLLPGTTGESPKQFGDRLHCQEYGALIFKFMKTRHTLRNMENMFMFCQKENLAGGLQTLVMVVSETEIPQDYRKFFAGSIYLDKNSPVKDSLLEWFKGKFPEKTAEHQDVLMKRIRKLIEQENENVGLVVFRAVNECLKAALLEEEPDEGRVRKITEALDQVIEEIDDSWNGQCDPAVYVTAFWKGLVDRIEDSGEALPPISHRLQVEGEALRKIDQSIFYDEKAYYFPAEFFSSVCEPFAKGVGEGFVKARLAEAGVLLSEGVSRHWTMKIGLLTAYGVPERKRRVKINRERLDSLGKFTVLELITIARGGDDLG